MGRKIQRLCGATAVEETVAAAAVPLTGALAAVPAGARSAMVDVAGQAERSRSGVAIGGE